MRFKTTLRPVNSLSHQIHQALCDKGYLRQGYDISIGQTVYTADIAYNTKMFSIQIEFDSETVSDFQVLPVVRIINLPEGIPKRMPHIEADSRLCFLDKETVFLDPFEPYKTFSALLDQVYTTLSQMVDSDKDKVAEEHSFEFSSYWGPESIAFLTSNESTGALYNYKRKKLNGTGANTEYAYLPHNNEAHKDAWFNAIPSFNEDAYSSDPAIYLQSHHLPLIAAGEAWPPKTFKEFFNWFKCIDPGNRDYFLNLIKDNFRSRTLHIIFKFKGDHIVGFTLTKTNMGIKTINSQIQRRAKNLTLIASLNSDKFLKPIKRFWVEDASQAFIQSRNNVRNLRDKRILVIGCGTIGGYLAHSLVQNGAGSGELGCLTLYDCDTYSTGNIGRHILGGRYLRQIKSHAMAYYLKNEFYSFNLNIVPHTKFEPNAIGKSLNYDLIIDATGESQFSTLLSKHWHQVSSKKPPILHGWIDASGGVVRSLLDDNKYACYYCLTKDKTPLEARKGKIKSIRRSCAGSSFFEFTSYASMTAAGLVLDKTLSFFHEERQPRFNHISLSKSVRHRKNENRPKFKRCPCCQT